jgi:hypothetical protein
MHNTIIKPAIPTESKLTGSEGRPAGIVQSASAALRLCHTNVPADPRQGPPSHGRPVRRHDTVLSIDCESVCSLSRSAPTLLRRSPLTASASWPIWPR